MEKPTVRTLVLVWTVLVVAAAVASAGEPAPAEVFVTLKVTNAGVREVIEQVARQADINIVVADDVAERITVEFNNEPWRDALRAVVEAKNLRVEERPDGVLYVSRRPEPGTPEKKRNDSVAGQGDKVDLTARDRRLGDILSELAREAGISIVVESGRVAKLEELKVPAERLMNIDLRGVPWPQALSLIAEKAGLEVEKLSEALFVVRRPHISFAFADAPVREVLDLIAKQSGMNIVVAPEVKGNVTMRFTEVPWLDALDVVVTSLGFSWRQDTPDTILVYGKATTALDKEVAFFEVKFLRARELASLLDTIVSSKKSYSFYSSEEMDMPGEGDLGDVVSVLERVIFRHAYRNILIVRDEPFVVRKIGELLSRYDNPRMFTMQVNLAHFDLRLTVNDKEISYRRDLSDAVKRAFYNRLVAEVQPLMSARGESRFEPILDTVFFHDDAWSLRLIEEYVNRSFQRLPFVSDYPVKRHSLLYKDPASIAEVLRNRLGPDAKVEVDPFLNTIVVAASASDQEYAEKLIGVLDIPPQNTVVVRVFKLRYALAENVAQRINELIKEAGQLLEKQRREAEKKAQEVETEKTRRTRLYAVGAQSATYQATVEQTDVLAKGLETVAEKASGEEVAGPEDAEGVPSARISGMLVGNAIADSGSNCVIVTTRAETLGVIQNIINELDVAPKQVLILAQILETSADKLKEVGIDWNIEGSISGSAAPTTFPLPKDSKHLRQWVGDINPDDRYPTGDIWPQGLNQVFPFVNERDFTIGTLSFAKLTATLKLLRDDSDTRLISSPQVATLNNHPAQFLVETSFEYRKRTDVTLGDGGQVAISYDTDKAKDKIQLNVTPQITPDGKIIMKLEPEVSNVVRFDILSNADGSEDKLPIVTSRKTMTRVMVASGRTLVLSGLIQDQDAFGVKGIPGLSKIPVVGKAFGKEKKETMRRNLVFFITPIIMEEGDEYLKEMSRARLDLWKDSQDPWTVIQTLPQSVQ